MKLRLPPWLTPRLPLWLTRVWKDRCCRDILTEPSLLLLLLYVKHSQAVSVELCPRVLSQLRYLHFE